MERNTSAGLSIGTGMALETIFKLKDRYDLEREPPAFVDIEEYDIHIFSIHTLVRNVINSLPRGNRGIEERDLANLVIDDLNMLNGYYTDVSTTLIISVANYDDLYREFNKNKEYKSTKKITDLVLLNDWVKMQKFEKNPTIEATVSKASDIKVGRKKVLVTTSMLLDVHLYGQFDLLESHTGVLKTYRELGSKYHKLGKKDFSFLPYSKNLHKILGDGTYVIPIKISERTRLLNIALDKKWNTRTSESRIREVLIKDTEYNKYIK